MLAPQWSPTGDQIIFGIGVFNAFFNGFNGLFLEAGDRAEGGAQIAMVNADGSGFRELTSGPNNNALPVDGARRQAFRLPLVRPGRRRPADHEPRDQGDHDADERLRQLPAVVAARRPDHVLAAAEGDYEIYTIKPDGTGLKRLTFSHGNDAHKAWSPDGEYIVFAVRAHGFQGRGHLHRRAAAVRRAVRDALRRQSMCSS